MNFRNFFAGALLLVGLAHAGDQRGVLTTLDGIKPNWPAAGLKARVIGANDGIVTVGNEVSFAYQAAQPGYSAIVHVSSHGAMTLARGQETSAVKEGRTETFGTVPPVGAETVYVLFSDQPFDALFGGEPAVELGDSREAARRFLDDLAQLQSRQKLATARLQYLLQPKAGVAVNTTRGITRIVKDMDKEPAPQNPGGAPAPNDPRVIPEPIEFALDSAELTERGKQQLDVFGQVMVDFHDRAIVLDGHADSTGEEDYNCELSLRRARAARDYLVRGIGIPAERITINAYGETQPAAPNDTEASRQRNRRVGFTFGRAGETFTPSPQACARP